MSDLRSKLFDVQPIKMVEAVYSAEKNLIKGSIQFQADATISESYSKSASITTYPVEDGGYLSDHSARTDFTIALSLVTSNSSMSYLGVLDNLTGSPLLGLVGNGQSQTKSQRAFNQLNKWMDEATPLYVYAFYAKSGFKSLNTGGLAPFLIESLSIPRDKSTGQAFRVDMTLKQVLIVTVSKGNPISNLFDKGATSLLSGSKSDAASGNNGPILDSEDQQLRNSAQEQGYWNPILGGG